MTRKSRKSRNRAAVTVRFLLLSSLSASSLIRMPCDGLVAREETGLQFVLPLQRRVVLVLHDRLLGERLLVPGLLGGLAGRGQLSVALLDLPLDRG